MKLAPLVLAITAGCSDREPAQVQPRAQQPRVVDPPAGAVRSLPPYAIRSDGVGRYSIGEKLAAVMSQLEFGPRIARFEIPNIVRASVIRAEAEQLLVGGEAGGIATYVAVVGPTVARTEGNVHVGSTSDELVQALGPAIDEPDRARPPRLIAPAKLRDARFAIVDDRVAAIVVVAGPPARKAAAGPEPECHRPPATTKAFGACLTPGGELVEVTDDELVIHDASSERVTASRKIPNLAFVAPLRNPTDHRDELIAIARADDGETRRWTISGFRIDGGKLVTAVEPEVLYQLSNVETSWIGAKLRDVELYLELGSRPDGIEVGGLLTTRSAGKVRDVVPITARHVARKHGKSPPAEPAEPGGTSARPPREPPSGAGADGR